MTSLHPDVLRGKAEHAPPSELRRVLLQVAGEIEADERATEAAIDRLSWTDAQMELPI